MDDGALAKLRLEADGFRDLAECVLDVEDSVDDAEGVLTKATENVNYTHKSAREVVRTITF